MLNPKINFRHKEVNEKKLQNIFFLFFFSLAAWCVMWDLSSPTRIEPMPPAVEAYINIF